MSAPDAASSTPAEAGPTVQARCSTVIEERGRLLPLLVRDEVREPGPHGGPEEARRDAVDRGERDDQPRARRRTAARRTFRPGRGRRRPSADAARAGRRAGRASARSATIGRKSAIRSAASQRPEPVRSKMSTESASAARYVPTADPAVAQKSSAKLRFRRSRDRRPVAPQARADATTRDKSETVAETGQCRAVR